MGLTKPSGGGGEYAELIFRICATRVGSFGIQFPITIRPPALVTRTISFATSKGFGANIAPKPFDVAKEMVRVTRSGGRIVMGNWIPNDPTLVAQILKISAAYTPPPPEGFVSPMTWGVENHVIERFGAAGIPADRISFARDTYRFEFPGTPKEFVATFTGFYGPTMNAVEAAEKNGRREELVRELETLFTSQNESKTATSIPATYLRVTVRV